MFQYSFVIFLLVCLSQLIPITGEIHTLNEKLMEGIIESSDSWLIVYKDDTVNINAFLESSSIKLQSNYGIQIGTVDCSVEKKLCRNAAIMTMPSLRMMTSATERNPYTNKLFRTTNDFKGNMLNLRELEKFISQSYPVSLVNTISTVKELESYSQLPICLLFSDKPTVSLMFRSVAHMFNNRMNFVYISLKVPNELSEQYKISSTTIGAFTNYSLSNELIQYDGDEMNVRSAITTFLSTFALETPIVTTTTTTDTTTDMNKDKDTPSTNEKDSYKSEKLQLNTLSTDDAWVIAVVEEGSEMSSILSTLTDACVGHIKQAALICSKADMNAEIIGESTATVGEKLLTFGQQICKTKNIPFLFALPHGTVERKKFAIQSSKWNDYIYTLSDHVKALESLGDSLPSSSVKGVYESGISEFVVEGLQKGLISFILLSNSAEPSALFKNVALSYSSIAQFGFISNPSDGIIPGLKLPGFIAIPPPTSDEDDKGMRVTNYDRRMFGPIKYSSLSQFVMSVVSNAAQKGFKMNGDSSTESEDSPEKTGQIELMTIVTEEDWTEHCGESYRGICVIGLLSPSASASASENKMVGKDVVNSVMNSVNTGTALHFLTVDAQCQQEFAQYFGVNGHEIPTVVIYSPSKRRYQVMKGSFSEISIKEFTQSVLSGRTGTVPMSVRPVVSPVCASNGEQEGAVGDSESSDDAEEFLREIRVEEEKKAAQIKTEIKEEQLRLAEEALKATKKKSSKKKKKKVKAKKSEL